MNNFKDKLNSFFFLDDENSTSPIAEGGEQSSHQEMKETEEKVIIRSNENRRKQNQRGGENVVAINQKQAIQKPRISIVEPRLYSEVQEVSDLLLGNQSVIVNFRRMDHEQASKMIDFLMGVTYAIKGDIQRLGDEIFICTPQSVEVNGSELSEFTESLL